MTSQELIWGLEKLFETGVLPYEQPLCPPTAALHEPPSPWAPRKVRTLHFLKFSLSVCLFWKKDLFVCLFDHLPNFELWMALVKCCSLVELVLVVVVLESSEWFYSDATFDGKYFRPFCCMHYKEYFRKTSSEKKWGLNDFLVWVFCNWDLRTMPRSSSEKKGHSSLTRVHIVRRNSNALFRNSATECNTFEMIFSETIFNETTSCRPAWADSYFLFLIFENFQGDNFMSTCLSRFLSLTSNVSCGTAVCTFNIRLISQMYFCSNVV